MAVAVIPAILTVTFLTLVVQKTYPMDTRGFTLSVSGEHPPQHLSRARNRRGSDGSKRIGIRSLYRNGYDHIGQFFECVDGGTVRENEK